ncbi:MAG TPA: serine hydrolase [Pyrinomonadaceae bacterium]|nr:serine hydrolase [Pyrinomonadaceae bacterium]
MKIQIFKQLFLLSLCITLFSALISAQQNKYAPLSDAKSTNSAIESLEKDIPNLMKQADIPGMSAALVRDGKLVWSKGFGVKNAETNEPVTNETIFEAASLSKVVFAYGVLKLVDEGKIDLDTPLNKYLGNNYDVGDDARLNLITARRVLSHTSGFPNWRANNSKTLPINFTPGEKFSYSGEGFVYLSKVVEKISGMQLEDFMQKTVLQPLQMTHSSYQWQDKYQNTAVYRHDSLGKKLFRNQGKDVNAAASLRTTAEDYGRFVVALLNGKGLKKKTWEAMFTPQINVNEKSPQVFWGLGLGLETTDEGKSFWHWGDQGDSKAYITAFLPKKNAIVYFANSSNGLSITSEILTDAIGGKHPGIAWLNYDRYDSPARTLLKTIIATGAAEPLKNYLEQRRQNSKLTITESQINNMGYALLRMKKVDDAIELFKQNTIDFPNSANAWDSLAEAYMTKGEKELAIKYYEKNLELNPKNDNAVEQLKKLKP